MSQCYTEELQLNPRSGPLLVELTVSRRSSSHGSGGENGTIHNAFHYVAVLTNSCSLERESLGVPPRSHQVSMHHLNNCIVPCVCACDEEKTILPGKTTQFTHTAVRTAETNPSIMGFGLDVLY